jgi:hypothetical protein
MDPAQNRALFPGRTVDFLITVEGCWPQAVHVRLFSEKSGGLAFTWGRVHVSCTPS